MKNNKELVKNISAFISSMLTFFVLFGISFAAEVGSSTYNPVSVCSISGNPTLKNIIMNLVIGCVLTRTAYLIIAAAIVVFLYGIFKFISSEGDDKQGGRELMFWGIVGIFVMTSFWGLAAILQNTFNF